MIIPNLLKLTINVTQTVGSFSLNLNITNLYMLP